MKNKTSSKKATREQTQAELSEALGIPICKRPETVCIYRIKCHYLPVIDHQKYPHARGELYSTDGYKDKLSAERFCRKLKRQHSRWIFWPEMTFKDAGKVVYAKKEPINDVLDLDAAAARHDRYIKH